jgi:hypothetical protein
MFCMIGGAGRVPSKKARMKSRPFIATITSTGVTPYSTVRAGVSVMEGSRLYQMIFIMPYDGYHPNE